MLNLLNKIPLYVKIIMEDNMNLFKINKFKRSVYDWGKSEEFFIYPVDASYEDKNYKIRLSRIEIEKHEEGFDRREGIKRFLVPISKNLVLNYNNTKMLIRKESTFRFTGKDKVTAMSEGDLFNLTLTEDVDGRLEVVKFKDKLIIKDDFVANKILFVYNLRNELSLRSVGKELVLKEGEFAVMIPNGKYEIDFQPSVNDNAIILGKVFL